MLKGEAERFLSRSPEELFDLAADVERYPEFLPWWSSAQVRERDSEGYLTDQTVGIGPLRLRFESKTILLRPKRIEVSSHEAPFRRLRLSWSFTPEPGGCRVGFAVELDFTSRLIEKVVERLLPGVASAIIDAFEARARRLPQAG